MQLQVDNDALQEAIRIIMRLAPPTEASGNIVLHSTGKKVFLKSNGDNARIEINLPAGVEGKPRTFAVALAALRDATKGRGQLEIVYDKTMCKVRSGKYLCELPTTDAMEIEEAPDEKLSSIEIDADQAQWLKESIKTVSLRPTPLISLFMPLAVKLTKKGAFVACYDSNHMAFIRSKEITGDIDLRIPIDLFASLLDVFVQSKFVLETSASTLYVSNKLIKVAMSLPQEDENDLKMEEIIEGANGAREASGTTFQVEKADIQKFMDNARAVATKERSEIKIKAGDGKMKFEVVTTNGLIKAVIPCTCKKEVSMVIDFEFLDEAIRKGASTLDLKLVSSEFLMLKLAKANVVISLNDEEQ